MKIEIEIKDEDIVDVLTTALEGGSNYWYYLPDVSMTEKIGFEKLCVSEKIIVAALKGEQIPVHDLENEEDLLGYLSKENIERGIKLFLADGYSFDAAMDADEADVLFQFIVMGEIVFS